MKGKQTPGVVVQPQVARALQRGIHKMVSAIRPTLDPVSGVVALDHMTSLDDLSRLTVATPSIKAAGCLLESVTVKHFGQARRMRADLKAFGIAGGG